MNSIIIQMESRAQAWPQTLWKRYLNGTLLSGIDQNPLERYLNGTLWSGIARNPFKTLFKWNPVIGDCPKPVQNVI